MILTDEPSLIYLQHSVPMKYRNSSMDLIIFLEKLLHDILRGKYQKRAPAYPLTSLGTKLWYSCPVRPEN